jgi:hypothetical protein
MRTVGNQQCWFDLHGIGVQLAALVAEQRIHRRNADFEQRKEGDVKLSHIAKLYQRRFAALNALRL